ncbi:hypothetical protein OHT52_21170 [Streptomyces sp. NBC_00247]|uniref:hypothetical protein n=1 Tax=Streptomyces sp. NBC_00247 TaxID=2975689 RepID=UPI002E2A4C91|nr:hypothetical protein [Streptomyces sp. NBC_00247]
MPRISYLIHNAETGRRLSIGTTDTDQPPADLAADLVQRNRTEHSYYTGPRTCWIWAPADESLAHLETAPAAAQRFDL